MKNRNKKENILLPINADKKIQLALGNYADGKRRLLSPSAGESIPEELPGFTEEACKSLMLQRERLKKLGLRMESKEEWVVSTSKDHHSPQSHEFIKDGNGLVAHLRNRMKICTSFIREKKGRVGSFEESLLVDYELLKTPEEDLRIVSETRLEQKGVFDCSCEYWKEGRWTLEKLGVGFYLFCLGSLSLIHIGSLVVFVLGYFMEAMVNHELGAVGFFLWIVTIFVVLPLSSYCERFPSYRHRRASAQVLQRIREAIPDFCRGDFVSMAESRIKALLFADTFQQVGEFVNGDVSGFLNSNAYVVNYESRNFWFHSFWQDMDNLHIEVISESFISKDNGSWIERGDKYIKVHFAKPLNGIMAGDWYVEKVEVVNKNGK